MAGQIPKMRSGAGPLFDKVAFDALIEADDGYGNKTTTFAEQFQMHAEFLYLRGGETVMAARLNKQVPAVVRVRHCQDTGRVTPEWQMRNVRTAETYNVREVTISATRGYFDLLVEAGVAS
jgi:SPP1 family predicted phage head-tail adaptor